MRPGPGPEFRALVLTRLPLPELPPERAVEIVEELASQMEQAYAEALAAGASLEDALVRAEAEVGSWDELAREIRAAEAPLQEALPATGRLLREPDPRRGGWAVAAAGLGQDLRYALRQMRRAPAFTAVAAVTLGLGMGVNIALFSVVNALLLRPLAVAEPDRLAGVYCREEGFLSHVPMAFPDYADLRASRRAFEDLAAYALRPFALDAQERSDVVMGECVTPNYFEVLRVRAALGRTFAPGEGEEAGTAAVAVLSHQAWTRRFGRDAGAVGRSLRLNGQPFTVIGVAPPSFRGLIPGLVPELWVPTGALGLFGGDATGDAVRRDRLQNRDSRWISVIGRLAPGATLEAARAEVALTGRRLASTYPATNARRVFDALATTSVRVLPGVDTVLYGVSGGLLAVSGLVVLIACANVAGMLLARGAARRHEMALRLSLGATRARVTRLLLAEGALLAALGCAGGMLLCAASNAALRSLELPLPVRIDLNLAFDTRLAGWGALLSGLVTVAAALLPALRMSRMDPGPVLKEHGPTFSRPGRLGSRLVVVQVALSVLLLCGAGLLLRSLRGAHQVDPGFDARGVAVLATDPSLRGMSRARGEDLYARLLARVEALPETGSAGFLSHLPLTFEVRTTRVALEGRAPADAREWPESDTAMAGPGALRTLGIPLRAGRDFAPSDRRDAPRVVIVNEAFVRRFLPEGDPLGRRVLVNGAKDSPAQVVGVVRDAKYRTLGEAPRPFLYQALTQSGDEGWTLLVRTAAPASLLPVLRRLLREVDDQVPIRSLTTLEEATGAALLLPRAGATLFGLLGLLGLALAATGVYGVVAQLAANRTQEIGVRIALGARARDIYGLVVGQGLRLGLQGAALGLVLAALATPALRVLLYGVPAHDPLTFAAAAAVLLAAVLAASSWPALRAARFSPQRLLRHP